MGGDFSIQGQNPKTIGSLPVDPDIAHNRAQRTGERGVAMQIRTSRSNNGTMEDHIS